jgi:hypothetical protein
MTTMLSASEAKKIEKVFKYGAAIEKVFNFHSATATT